MAQVIDDVELVGWVLNNFLEESIVAHALLLCFVQNIALFEQ